MPHLAHITLLVRDYDEALAFYTGTLGFTLIEDTYQPEQGKRWVTIRPPGAPADATNILLARATTPEQTAAIGNQSGGRVFLFLATDDFDRDYAAYTQAGVNFVRPPQVQPYGKVAVFEDLYGNRWDLVQSGGGVPSPLPGVSPGMHRATALAEPQTARTSLRLGEKLRLETDLRVTPAGLLAIGALVSAILLSVPPIVRAAARAAPGTRK